MADNTILKVALFGGAGYLAYRMFFASPAAASNPPATSAGTPAAAVTPAAPATGATTFNSLDQIYTRMVAAASAAGVTSSGTNSDGWNVYLSQAGGPTPPDPVLVFGDAIAGAARQNPMTAAQYWSKMAPYLAAHNGLSGLGFFGSIARRGW